MINVDITNILIRRNSNWHVLVSPIQATLHEGHIYTITGKNGAGKTTLLYSFAALLDKTTFQVNGGINFNGQNIFELSQDELVKLRKNDISYVFQDPVNSFDPLKKLSSLFEEISIPDDQLNDLFEYFQLSNIDEILDFYPFQLSVGMAQRIQIIYAMLRKPKLLLLDEPTASIDKRTANLLTAKLKQFAKSANCCVLIVSQDNHFVNAVSDFTAELSEKGLDGFLEKPI